MCGRYRLTQAERFAEMSNVRLAWNPKPRYNIAPTQTLPVLLDARPDELAELRWGLIPFWAQDKKVASGLINARAETVGSKPAFRDAYQKRRCLVPADGFYEWKKIDGGIIPHHIRMADGAPFAFAGLWESWRDPLRPPDGEPVRTFTIITGEPNELVATIHNRMPVIIPRDRYEEWLSPETNAEQRKALLVPYPAEQMVADPISPRVNSTRNDDPSVLEWNGPLSYKVKEKPAKEAASLAVEATGWLFPPM